MDYVSRAKTFPADQASAAYKFAGEKMRATPEVRCGNPMVATLKDGAIKVHYLVRVYARKEAKPA
jgi:hypothetical protein